MYIYSAQLRLWPDIGRKAETLKDIALPLSYQVAPMKRAHIPPILPIALILYSLNHHLNRYIVVA